MAKPFVFYVAGGWPSQIRCDIDSMEWIENTEMLVRRTARRQAKLSGQFGGWPICKVTIEELPLEQTDKLMPKGRGS